MVNDFEGPAQLTEPLVNVGVTVMVETIGAVVVFSAVKALILPFPPTPRPVAVLSFDQA